MANWEGIIPKTNSGSFLQRLRSIFEPGILLPDLDRGLLGRDGMGKVFKATGTHITESVLAKALDSGDHN
jgi:hypothetical protein